MTNSYVFLPWGAATFPNVCVFCTPPKGTVICLFPPPNIELVLLFVLLDDPKIVLLLPNDDLPPKTVLLTVDLLPKALDVVKGLLLLWAKTFVVWLEFEPIWDCPKA